YAQVAGDLGPGPPRLLAQPDGIALERLVEAAALRAAGVGGGGGGFGRLAHISVRFGDLLFPVHGILACSSRPSERSRLSHSTLSHQDEWKSCPSSTTTASKRSSSNRSMAFSNLWAASVVQKSL